MRTFKQFVTPELKPNFVEGVKDFLVVRASGRSWVCWSDFSDLVRYFLKDSHTILCARHYWITFSPHRQSRHDVVATLDSSWDIAFPGMDDDCESMHTLYDRLSSGLKKAGFKSDDKVYVGLEYE